MRTAKTINVIGCGNVGKTLSRLWTQNKVFQVRSFLNRSLASGERAVQFVGCGRAAQSLDDVEPADLCMISVCDTSIEQCCGELARSGVLEEKNIVFHCSGSLPSTVLDPLRAHGAHIASVHPLKSFADPATAVETFSGTYCAIEGDSEACEVLRHAFQRCGATTFSVDPQQKTIYHAGTVFASNYLVALMEVAFRCLRQAGIPEPMIAKVIEPLVTGTVDNVTAFGPARALTGPIARGDVSVVAQHCEALAHWNEDMCRLYQSLGRVTTELSAAQGHAGAEALAEIQHLLEE